MPPIVSNFPFFKGHLPPPKVAPCQYQTGRTLGSGTYAVVKEAVKIDTGERFACKVISKKLMRGREDMIRNEILALRKVSKGHRHIVTLHDSFETENNLYLVFDLCSGGELFDRICAKGYYFENDAAVLVRTITQAVQYIHHCGIVHRDLKPENLIFRTQDEKADIMVADFGLSKFLEEQKLQLLTEICGTPGYMAPEVYLRSGHDFAVDIWAIGVITYFLLAGYTPFDRDTQEQERDAIIKGDYKFEPVGYWSCISDTAKDFIRTCLNADPTERPTAEGLLKHLWLRDPAVPHYVEDKDGNPTDLLPGLKEQKSKFDARRAWRRAFLPITAVKRLTMLHQSSLSPGAQDLVRRLTEYKEEAENEQINEGQDVVYATPVDQDEPMVVDG